MKVIMEGDMYMARRGHIEGVKRKEKGRSEML